MNCGKGQALCQEVISRLVQRRLLRRDSGPLAADASWTQPSGNSYIHYMNSEMPPTSSDVGGDRLVHSHAVVHSDERNALPVTDDLRHARGLAFASLIGPAEGSVHMEVGHSELAGGGYISGHLHPFEETFYILDGEVLLRSQGRDYALGVGDFGVIPLGVPHSWRNPGDAPVRWLRVRAPQPRDLTDRARISIPCEGFELPQQGAAPPVGLPHVANLGHFESSQMPPPGPVAIRGANNYSVRNISVRLMVDDVAGAHHHIMFTGQMESDPSTIADVPPPHYHAFEEMYYFVGGTARGILEGNEFDIRPGDVAFAGVNATHGFIPTSSDPLRWVEVMAPRPPEQNSMMFVNQWDAVARAAGEGRW